MPMLTRLFANLFRLLFGLLALPFRLLLLGKRPAYVRFRLAGDLPYQTPKRLWPFRASERSRVVSLEQFADDLALLASDSRVSGLVLTFEGLSVSAAKRSALAKAIAKARAAGKEVIAHAITASTSEYILMCEADRILLAPGGRLELTGFSAEATALGAFLKHLGVGAHFVRRGDHKTAPELFTRNDISPIQRQTLEGVLEERYRDLISVMVRNRQMTSEQAQACVDGGPYTARRALAQKLCDGLCSEIELAETLAKTKSKSRAEPPLPTMRSYLRTRPLGRAAWHPLRAGPKVSIVSLSGAIFHGSGRAPVGPRASFADDVGASLRRAGEDRRTRAVVLFVDSPGGSAIGSEVILEQVKRLSAKKPVVAYFDRVAASGGYLAALGAREIWAAPLSIVGSIGVFGGKLEVSSLLQKLGIHREVLTRGANAGMASTSRPFTDREKQALEAEVEETYQSFLQHVAQARKLPLEQAQARAEGRIYSGNAAHEMGLVDAVGSLDAACQRALALANRPTERFSVSWIRNRAQNRTWHSLLTLVGHTHLWALWPGAWDAFGPGEQ